MKKLVENEVVFCAQNVEKPMQQPESESRWKNTSESKYETIVSTKFMDLKGNIEECYLYYSLL